MIARILHRFRVPGWTQNRMLTRCVSSLILGSAQLLKEALQVRKPVPMEQNFYFISVAARMLGMHPQTLRKYERLGLVQPTRTIGSMRLYSREELERLRIIKRLVDDGGINLAGVQRLLSIAEVVTRIRPLVTSPATSRDESARDVRRRLAQEV